MRQVLTIYFWTAERRVVPGGVPDEYKVSSFMTVTLSCDHRVIDGMRSNQNFLFPLRPVCLDPLLPQWSFYKFYAQVFLTLFYDVKVQLVRSGSRRSKATSRIQFPCCFKRDAASLWRKFCANWIFLIITTVSCLEKFCCRLVFQINTHRYWHFVAQLGDQEAHFSLYDVLDLFLEELHEKFAAIFCASK